MANPQDKTRWEWTSGTSSREAAAERFPDQPAADATVTPTEAVVHTRIHAPSREDEVEPAPADARDLVTGWLVIIKGPGRGAAVPLGIGVNSVGRDADARARIDFGDDLISRRNHATVIYDDRDRRYFVQHGEGKNLTRLNGTLVTALTPLKHGDRVELSAETTVRFVPCCGDDFDWSDAA